MISARWLTKLWYEQRSSSPAGREDVERNFPVRAPPPRSDWMAWRSASCWADSFWEGFRGSITIVTTQTQIDRHLMAVFQLLSFLLKSSPWTGTVYLTQNSEQQIYEVLDSFWWYRFPTVVQTELGANGATKTHHENVSKAKTKEVSTPCLVVLAYFTFIKMQE